MITVEEAWKRILDTVPAMGSECVSLSEMIGRVLAEPILSPLDLPVFTNSAVDGYAVYAQDSGANAKLKVVANIAAGDFSNLQLQEGECARVFTGSPIPAGADAVVMQEDAKADSAAITLTQTIQTGEGVRYQGEEAKAGQLIFESGTLISPPVLGVLSELGIARANVHKRPRVAIVGTGSELAAPGAELKPGQIYESNTTAISTAAQLSGANVISVTSVRDDLLPIKQAIENALSTSDVVITCGGVSVGDHDLVRQCCEELGVKEIFWRVAMRPGKPFYFGMSNKGQPVFGLPGNPVSALVTFFVLVRPAIRKMIGMAREEVWLRARLAAPYHKRKGRTEFIRLRQQVAAELSVVPVDGQGSHMLTGLAEAQYIGYLADFRDNFEPGDVIDVTRLTWGLV